MKPVVKLSIDPVSQITKEILVPEGVFKEMVYDYQDPKGYYRYFYTSKSGKKKQCKVVIV